MYKSNYNNNNVPIYPNNTSTFVSFIANRLYIHLYQNMCHFLVTPVVSVLTPPFSPTGFSTCTYSCLYSPREHILATLRYPSLVVPSGTVQSLRPAVTTLSGRPASRVGERGFAPPSTKEY